MQNSQRTKILFIITKSAWGGAQRYVFDLATNLPKDEFEVAIACGHASKTNTETLSEKLQNTITVFPILHFQKSINPLKELLSFFEILSVCIRFQPDIVHSNSSKAGGIAGLAALLYQLIYRKRIKRVFTVHGWAFLETWRPRWQRVLIRILSKTTALLYNHIIVISTADYDSAKAYNVAPAHKVTLIHNGIGAMEFLPRKNAQQELLGKEYPLIIGTIAEWTKNKGIKHLIEAIPGVLTTFPEAVVCLVGWGEEYLKLETCILKLKLENNVFLVSKSSAAQYLKAFDIFVLPSLKEGLPYTILEAGLAELIVITTRVGGIPDIIEHEKEGLLVNPASTEELVRALIKLLKDKNIRKQLGHALYERVVQHFSLEEMLTKTITLYRKYIR